MNKRKWVRHISGEGGVWEIIGDTAPNVQAWPVQSNAGILMLPKSEFVLCELPQPPEQWVDVTSECYIARDMTIFHEGVDTFNGPYRRRKVHLYELKLNHPQSYIARDAFIIEKKVSL